MGLLHTCDHDGPGGRLFRFCGACGKLIHPKMVPLGQCEERHAFKRDIGYAFCVDCGAEIPERRIQPPRVPQEHEPEEGARILDFPGPVRT